MELDRVEAGLADLAVVLVADLGAVGRHRRASMPPAGPAACVAGQGDAERRDAVLAHRVTHHPAPAAADVQQAHSGLQRRASGDQVELVLLRLLQRRVVAG